MVTGYDHMQVTGYDIIGCTYVVVVVVKHFKLKQLSVLQVALRETVPLLLITSVTIAHFLVLCD